MGETKKEIKEERKRETESTNWSTLMNDVLIQEKIKHDVIFVFSGLHSTLLVSFHLQRHMGNFVIQVNGHPWMTSLKYAYFSTRYPLRHTFKKF